MPQFGAYLTIIIYDCKTFIVQATGKLECLSLPPYEWRLVMGLSSHCLDPHPCLRILFKGGTHV